MPVVPARAAGSPESEQAHPLSDASVVLVRDPLIERFLKDSLKLLVDRAVLVGGDCSELIVNLNRDVY